VLRSGQLVWTVAEPVWIVDGEGRQFLCLGASTVVCAVLECILLDSIKKEKRKKKRKEERREEKEKGGEEKRGKRVEKRRGDNLQH
jgi:hypothetical protein